ncbi:hypothetical protein IJM16_03695 [Candidatus Saccharibacteria bacterium]|nr:hypothetical protein [Candidatus Saccharibacteria bacterium]
MINIIAIVLIIFSVMQILTGIATICGKFDPLLPKERKKLPAKYRRKAQLLNAISMIVTSLIFCVLSIGMLLNLQILILISAILMVLFILVMLPISIKAEAKHLK